LLDAGAELLLRLYGGPLRVVAACTGHAIAMGVFILHACDTRIGTAGDYKIGANEAITGMNLPIFAMELARDRLHPSHLTRAMVQGFIYTPEGAVEAGYLDMLAQANEVEAKALAVAGQLAQLPAPAYAWNKKAIRKATLDRIRPHLRPLSLNHTSGAAHKLISHRPGIVGVADRLLILHQGSVQASGPRDGVLAALQQQREAAQVSQATPPSSNS
jgi:enoyl-CoA hydratase/carnithine racemase